MPPNYLEAIVGILTMSTLASLIFGLVGLMFTDKTFKRFAALFMWAVKSLAALYAATFVVLILAWLSLHLNP